MHIYVETPEPRVGPLAVQEVTPAVPVIVHVEAVGLLVGAGSVVLVPLTVAVKVRVFPRDALDAPVTLIVGVFFETTIWVGVGVPVVEVEL